MNNKSKFTKDQWANGQPSVEIAPYDFSPKGFQRMLDALINFYSIPQPEVISGADKIRTTVSIKDEYVEIDMDASTCSLAFHTQALRDEVFLLLKKSV